MADRVSVAIMLGGIIHAQDLGDLLDAISAETASTDWDGAPFELSDLPARQPLRLVAHEVAWGSFDLIESCCQRLGGRRLLRRRSPGRSWRPNEPRWRRGRE